MLTQTSAETATAARPALLFVDDERRVLTSMRALFRREFDVLLANSGQEALEILAQREVHVVVSDQRMPEMTGVQLLAQVREDYPGSMRILLTGYADLEAVEASINESEVFRYLMKPCPSEELKDSVRLAVQAARVQNVATMIELETMMGGSVEDIELTQLPVDEPVQEMPANEDTADGEDSEVLDPESEQAKRDSESTIAPAPYQAPAGVPDSVMAVVNDAQQQPIGAMASPEPDILVLSRDDRLLEGVALAIGPQCHIRHANNVDEALDVLGKFPVGVLITDLAVDEEEIDQLTCTLKQEVPELVTIIASERSDASLLIGLINHGQIFRFLLKPLHVAQTRIWLSSAVARYKELCYDEAAVLRHQVARSEEVEAANKSLFANVRARVGRIKQRLAASLAMGLRRD